MLFFENYQDYGMRDTFIPKPKQKSIPWNISPKLHPNFARLVPSAHNLRS